MKKIIHKLKEGWWDRRSNPDMILVWPEALLVWVVVVGLLVYCIVKS